MAFPFTKIFDHKEDLFHVESSFDWKSCKITPYRDGQLVTLFSYQNRWIAACYSDFRSHKKYGKIGTEIFWRLWKERGLVLPGIH